MSDLISEAVVNKWASVLDHEKFSKIQDRTRRSVTAAMLENTQKSFESNKSPVMNSLMETTNIVGNDGFTGAADPSGPVAGYDPVLISLVRRTMPNLIAYDVAGVQPLNQPTGLVFAMRTMYANDPADSSTWTESNFNEPDTAYSGAGNHGDPMGSADTVDTGTGMETGVGEALGTPAGNAYPEMSVSVEKVAIEAKTRALKAKYTDEFAQDLKNVHGIDAETELANMLAGEIVAEMNRELIRTVYNVARPGAQSGDTVTPGIFDLDVDANGRWSNEKFKGLMFQIEREANQIARWTRQNKGNIIICSSDVASALQHVGILDYTPAVNNNLEINDAGSTFAGVMNGRYRVYVDPYASGQYLVVGYKGQNAWDAGVIYSPYMPLQWMKARDYDSFHPAIGFKTRYGLIANPFAQGTTRGLGEILPNTNAYYSKIRVNNLM